MLELILLVGALGGIGARARQRRVNKTGAVATAFGGWLAISLAQTVMPQPAGLLLRWLWVGAVYLVIELAHGAKKAADTWQCPECTLFNDRGTLICLCGYENPETAAARTPVG